MPDQIGHTLRQRERVTAWRKRITGIERLGFRAGFRKGYQGHRLFVHDTAR